MAAALSRRRVLQFGVVGAAVVTILGVAGADLSRRGVVRGVLGERELQALTAIAARLCPGGPDLLGADAVGLAERTHLFLQTADPQIQQDLAGLLRIFASRWGGLLLDGRFSAFTSLSAEAQDRVLHGWRRSGLALKRGAFAAIRSLVVSRYWADSRVYRSTGYPGPPRFAAPSIEQEITP